MSTTREHGARTVIAVFSDRSGAHDAARKLHDAGYKDTWIATTRPHGPTDDARGTEPGTLTGTMDGTDVVKGASGNIFGKIGRFFAGTDYTLGEALREHGVCDPDAGQLEESIPPGSSVLTVKVSDDARAGSQDPASILEDCGGRLVTPSSGVTTGDQQLERREGAGQIIPESLERDDVPTLHEEFFTERRSVPK